MAFKMKGSPMQRNFGIGSPIKKTTDREAMREAARKKNKKDAVKMRKVLNRKGEYAAGPMEYKEVHGTYQKPGGLPRAKNEGAVAHTLRKAATWLGVANKKAESKEAKRNTNTGPTPASR